MDEYQIASKIINAAIEVHKHLGPNLLENNYETCLAYELTEMGLNFERNVSYPFFYKGKDRESGYHINLIVEKKVVVEIRSVENIYDVHKDKVLTFMKLTNLKYGLILNFNVSFISIGIKRIIIKGG